MYLLYLDESGTSGDSTHQHFVLAGAAVFEHAVRRVEHDLQQVARRFHPSNPAAIELHASPMRSGKGPWRTLTAADRARALLDCLEIVRSHCPHNLCLFGAVVKKSSASELRSPIETAFEHICSQFDLFLEGVPFERGESQRGLILFDESRAEELIQSRALDFRSLGHRWGTACHSVEVPVFLDSRASRLIQLADLIAFALFRKHEFGDETLFSEICGCFETDRGVHHALDQRH